MTLTELENMLKPCPFCGCKASVIKDESYLDIFCDNCPVVAEYLSLEPNKPLKAVAIWNRRAEK